MERLLYDNIADPYQLNPIKIDKIEENPLAEKFEKILKEWANKYQDNFKF